MASLEQVIPDELAEVVIPWLGLIPRQDFESRGSLILPRQLVSQAHIGQVEGVSCRTRAIFDLSRLTERLFFVLPGHEAGRFRGAGRTTVRHPGAARRTQG